MSNVEGSQITIGHTASVPSPTLVPTNVLDFMRGFAAVYVVINHVRGNFFKGGGRTIAEATDPLGLYDYASIALLQLTALGTEFVVLFFCVSGFAMAHSMLNRPTAMYFYSRRFVRIWPPYMGAIIFAAIVCLLYARYDPGSRDSVQCWEKLCTFEGLVLMATYVKVATPITAQFWSLPYEVIFYLLCPILLWRRAYIPAIFGLTVVVSLASVPFWGLGMNPSGSVLVNFAINAAFWFMAGVLAYHHIDKVPEIATRAFIVCSLGLLGVILVVKTAYGGSNAISNALMIAFSVMCIRNLPRSWASRPLWNWGYFSYSIYIYHVAFIALIALILEQNFNIRGEDIASYWFWLLVLPCVLVGSWAMYFLGEKQCNDLLRRMKSSQVVASK